MAAQDEPDHEVLRVVDDWPGDGRGVGVADRDGVLGVHGDVDARFPMMSVTKTLSAYTVLRLVADGLVDLDEPAGREGSTVRHLLAHAAGYPFDGTDRLQPVGKRRVYSNAGFEVLGAFVEEVAGEPFPALLDTWVCEPLGMADTTLEGSPAHAGTSTVRDLLAFGRELLVPTLLPAWLHAQAVHPVFDDLAGVLPGFGRQDPNPWGLGLEVRGDKSPHWTGTRNSPATFGHFGQSGSFLWVDPDAGLVAASLGDEPFGEWATTAWPELSDAVLDAFA